MRRRPGGDPLEGEYERHRGAVMGMLNKRFSRLDEDDRLAIYHDAWVRVMAKRERGEEIESLRAYLMATCAAEALHLVTRSRAPLPVDPGEPVLTSIEDERVRVEEEVVVKDQARLARDLIDSLDARQREVMKLRWDLQLRGPEVRAALGLTRRQYQRLAEQGAAEVAKRVTELEDGTWSRKHRSLLMACLVRVTMDGEEREGIASARQRKEAQRLLETDPHFAALYAEVRGALKRAAALLPLPVLVGAEEASAAGDLSALADIRERATELAGQAKQQATALYVRAADPTLFAGGARPGTVAAAVAGCVAVGGGAFGAYDAVSKQQPPPVRASTADVAIKPIANAPLPDDGAIDEIRHAARKRHERPKPSPVSPPVPAPETAPPPPTPTIVQPTPTTQPKPPTGGTEFGFEN